MRSRQYVLPTLLLFSSCEKSIEIAKPRPHEGRPLYNEFCAPCHGKDLRGKDVDIRNLAQGYMVHKGTPNLLTHQNATQEQLMEHIDGKIRSGGEYMPSFIDKRHVKSGIITRTLNGNEIALIADYVLNGDHWE